MSNLINTQRFSVDTDVEERGFIPELVTVADGSYDTPIFGAGAPVVNTYGPSGANIILPRGTSTVPILGPGFPFVSSRTGCSIRQHGKNVEFECCVSLSGAAPGFPDNDELRIRPLPPTITQPARWNNPLPIPFNNNEFFNVEVLYGTNGALVPPDFFDTVYRARILPNGWLTLYLFHTPLNVETAIDNVYLNLKLNSTQVINIIVRGKYLAA